MCLAKATPEGLKDSKYKRITLYERPLISYIPKKDSVKEMVSSLKASLKTQIGKDKEQRVSIWHSGTCNAFLMHVGLALDAAIKKRGHFKAHEEASNAYLEQCNLVKQAKAALAELDRTTIKGARTSKKSSKKHKEAAATADTPEPNM